MAGKPSSTAGQETRYIFLKCRPNQADKRSIVQTRAGTSRTLALTTS